MYGVIFDHLRFYDPPIVFEKENVDPFALDATLLSSFQTEMAQDTIITSKKTKRFGARMTLTAVKSKASGELINFLPNMMRAQHVRKYSILFVISLCTTFVFVQRGTG
ncbi:hypothetical protein CEXT_702721 [Caerostris extrusa]|uniref:Uncharacterized protein n=1 Tax=Caerostris extrusa TaxID=172846 RepID=A0AAV4NK51_CAEEX|nr:hypothetical protein CEXT_702721 [Caerostris extrusa]